MQHNRLEKIQQMESILNQLDEKMNEAEVFFEQWSKTQALFKTLIEYYHSPQWISDYRASNNNEIPEKIPCGVLSEDAIYTLITRRYQWAISNLKLITSILDNE